MQTGRAGRRAVLDGATNELRFYPQVGETRFGRLRSFISPNYPDDIALEMSASDADTTDYVVRLQLLPDFATLHTAREGEPTALSIVTALRDLAELGLYTGGTVGVRDGGYSQEPIDLHQTDKPPEEPC